jgi:hypothetical protein
MTEHFQQRGQRQLLVRCTAAWRAHVSVRHSAQQLLQQVQLRQLQACYEAWVLLTQQSK